MAFKSRVPLRIEKIYGSYMLKFVVFGIHDSDHNFSALFRVYDKTVNKSGAKVTS